MEAHELRIALVLNGGVSLAVWMGGVVHELDLLRRASAPDDEGKPGPQDYDRNVFDRWRSLCWGAQQPRRVVVDVIAGTSAGGLNGSLLATAIAHGGTLDPPDAEPGPWLRQRWSALGALMPGQLLPRETEPVPSVLDGRYFLDQLTDVLGNVAKVGNHRASDPVTLFVTASGLGPHGFAVQDAAKQPFVVADHRFLYQFSNEARVRYSPHHGFTEEAPTGFQQIEDLAYASRASASFPGAFEPLSETTELAAKPPRVRPKAATETSWVIDGGVLDNAPIAPVLDVVARRPVTERATRYVLYVVPSAGVDMADITGRRYEKPDAKKAVLSALRYPREADFRSDVEHLEELLLEADASWSDTQQLYDRCMRDHDEANRVLRAAQLLQPAYVRGRAAGGVWEAITLATSNQTTVLDATTSIADADVDAILAEEPQWVPRIGEPPVPTQFTLDGPVWPWGTGPAERVLRLVMRSYRQRLDATMESDGVDSTVAALKSPLKTVNDTVERVIAIRDALTEEIARTQIQPNDLPVAVTASVNAAFSALRVPAALGAEMAELASRFPEEVQTALAVEIVSRCTSSRTPLQRSAPFSFLRLGPDVLLPVLDNTPVQQRAIELGEHILFGTQVGHFGAFGAADWRRWDWLMGRLHGAAHLGRLLGADDEWVRETQLAILESEKQTLDDVTTKIRRLSEAFAPGPAQARRALLEMRNELNETDAGQQTVRGLVDRLVEVAPRFSPAAGQWVHALAARQDRPQRPSQRWARWFTRSARNLLWQRLVREPQLGPAPRPWFLSRWPVAGLFLLAALFVVTALLADGVGAVVLGALGGAALTTGVGLLATRLWLDSKRRWLRQKVDALLPPLPDGPPAP